MRAGQVSRRRSSRSRSIRPATSGSLHQSSKVCRIMRQVSTEPQVPVRRLPAGDPGQHFRRQAALHEPPGVGRGAGIARPAAPDTPPRSAGRPTGGDAVLVERQRVVGEEALAARRECGPDRCLTIARRRGERVHVLPPMQRQQAVLQSQRQPRRAQRKHRRSNGAMSSGPSSGCSHRLPRGGVHPTGMLSVPGCRRTATSGLPLRSRGVCAALRRSES